MNTYLFAMGLFLLAFTGGANLQRPEPSIYVSLVVNISIVLGMCFWMESQMRRAGYQPAFEYRAFIFLGWPVVFPYYLVRIYRWRAPLLVVLFAALWVIGSVSGQYVGFYFP